MSRGDYRPADYQIDTIYQCDTCGREHIESSVYAVSSCSCGGRLVQTGEQYPADSGDWEEQRDPDGEWRERR